MEEPDWHGWHTGYDAPGSPLWRRLRVVRAAISGVLDAGARTVVSLCAGQGRDLLETGGVQAVEVRGHLQDLRDGH
ncbi:hypothetical protein AB0K48_47160, partial [Nonomuraea sp. NPDC055795]